MGLLSATLKTNKLSELYRSRESALSTTLIRFFFVKNDFLFLFAPSKTGKTLNLELNFINFDTLVLLFRSTKGGNLRMVKPTPYCLQESNKNSSHSNLALA